jgi:hypothetical protein
MKPRKPRIYYTETDKALTKIRTMRHRLIDAGQYYSCFQIDWPRVSGPGGAHHFS